MTKVLVTGASGFAGGALAMELARQGAPVVAFVRPTSNSDHLLQAGIECRTLDLKEAAEVRRQMQDISCVYHLAAAYRGELVDREECTRVNVDGTRNLLEAAVEQGVARFVHVSTVGVQGHIEAPPADEEYRFKPHDHYQSSKLQGEELARAFFAAGLPGTVVRPAALYGPGDTRFLKLIWGIDRRVFVMIGPGRNFYHLTYVDDLVQGILLAGERPEALNQVFTIAGEHYTTTRELVETIADLLGRKPPRLRLPIRPAYAAAVVCDRVFRAMNRSPPLYPRRLDFFVMSRAFSIEKARRVLGYQPQVDLVEGLRRTIDWYRREGML